MFERGEHEAGAKDEPQDKGQQAAQQLGDSVEASDVGRSQVRSVDRPTTATIARRSCQVDGAASRQLPVDLALPTARPHRYVVVVVAGAYAVPGALSGSAGTRMAYWTA